MRNPVLRTYWWQCVVFILCVLGLASPQARAQSLTVGGLVFTDLDNILFSGLNGAIVELEGVEGTTGHFQTVTSLDAVAGQWAFDSIPPGTYRVSITLQGWGFVRLRATGSGEVLEEEVPFDLDVNEETIVECPFRKPHLVG